MSRVSRLREPRRRLGDCAADCFGLEWYRARHPNHHRGDVQAADGGLECELAVLADGGIHGRSRSSAESETPSPARMKVLPMTCNLSGIASDEGRFL